MMEVDDDDDGDYYDDELPFCPLLQQHSLTILSVNHETVTSLDDHYAKMIQALWEDNGIQEAYDRRREFQLSDSAKQ